MWNETGISLNAGRLVGGVTFKFPFPSAPVDSSVLTHSGLHYFSAMSWVNYGDGTMMEMCTMMKMCQQCKMTSCLFSKLTLRFKSHMALKKKKHKN